MSSWTERPLGDLLEVLIDHRGKTPKKLGGDGFTDSGVPVVSAMHVRNGRVDLNLQRRYVPEWMFKRWMPIRLQRGDVLLTSEAATFGAIAQVPTNDDLVLSQRLFALRGRSGVLDSSYLRYFLESEPGQQRLRERTSGSSVTGIRQSELVSVLVPVRDFAEQRRIAAVLASLDDLVETSDALARGLAEIQMATFLDRWNGKARTNLADVASVTMGQSPHGDTYNEAGEGTTFYQGTRDFGWRYPSRRVWTTQPTRLASAGDVLVAVRAPVGALNLATEETALGRGLAGLRAIGRQATLLQALQADSGVWDMHQGTGTVFASINKAGLSDLSIPWVDDDDLEALLAGLDSAVLQLTEESNSLRRTRDELLPLLMSGRVRVSEDLVVA